MAGLSTELYNRCRSTMLKCSEFDTNASLRAVFVTDELRPFRGELPEADRKSGRVDTCLAYLMDKRLSDGRAVLPLFLAALRDRYQPGDALHDELGALAAEMGRAMTRMAGSTSSTSSPPGGSGVALSDSYSLYETGLRQLLDRLGGGHPRYGEALVYQQRLAENMAGARRYGDTETRRAERAEIVGHLNELALTALGMSFNELCGLP